jgi:Protein of unknown function (DUF3822)
MNESITNRNYKKLALQVATTGISFCGFDTLNGQVANLNYIPFAKGSNVDDELWKVFVHHPELKLKCDETIVLHNNSFNTLVPNALFDENYPGSYLQYSTRVFEGDVFAWDNLAGHDITNVYVPLMNINNFLIERLGSFDYKNSNSILVEKLLDASVNVEEKQVYVHIQPTHFEIIVARDQKLLLFNSFEYAASTDFLYYLLFTLEQLSLNPETVKVWLLGDITAQSPLFEAAYTYIRHVALYNTTTLAKKWQVTPQEASTHFILLNA